MQYLITFIDQEDEPFFSDWFSFEMFDPNRMVVYDIINKCYTNNGQNWIDIEIDTL